MTSPIQPASSLSTVRIRGMETSISEASKKILFSTGELGQNLKAQTRLSGKRLGAESEPWRIAMYSTVILTLPARVSEQAPRFQLCRDDHSL